MNASSAAQRFNIISKWLPKDAIGVEAGVFKGAFSKELVKITRKLYLCDPWYRLSPTWNWVTNENNSTYDAFLGIMKDFENEIKAQTVIPVVDFAKNFFLTAPSAYFDFIYLDTAHAYEGTIEELELGIKILKPGGVFCGDDWHDDIHHKHYGVTKAIKEFISHGRCSLLFPPSNLQWCLKVEE